MLPTPEEGSQAPEVRISDVDRERMVEVLRRHCAEGRLTLDEFADRVGVVYDARTRRELDVLVRDLPEVSIPAAPEPPAKGKGRKAVRWTVAVLSGNSQRGRWRVEGETNALAIMGGCTLDLRNAEIVGAEATINATAFMGGIDIIVPEGVEVDMTGFDFMGGRDCRISGKRLPGTPLIRVKAVAVMGGVSVQTKLAAAERTEGALNQADRMRQRAEQRADRMRQQAEQRAERMRQRADRHRHRFDKPCGWSMQPPWKDEGEIDDLVEETEPEIRSAAAPDGTVTMMITDIEGSSAMAIALGDQRWLELLRGHNQIIRRCVNNQGGSEIKAQGDGFMIAFPSARRALLCARAIQKAFETHRKENPEEDVEVRIGLHTGEVVREGDDFFGKNVILAARIANEAKGGEILVSSLTKELTESAGDLAFNGEREVTLKGLARPYRVYSLDW